MSEHDPTVAMAVPGGGGERQFRPGDRLGDRFVIVQFMARGGMGEVYEAIDQHLQGKHIALKTLRVEMVDNAEMRGRFEREVLLAREVNHRNVCPTYDLCRLEGPRGMVLCLTMKLLRGESLAARLSRLGPMGPEAALPLVRQMAAGLDAAHAAGVIHRDFKPGNVMVDYMTENPQVTITDFGLSRLYDGDQSLITSNVSGTRGYIAPELFDGRSASPASDVYAFGVVVYEMLTGRPPLTGVGSRDRSKRSDFGTGVPEAWDRMVTGCLEADPSQRFQSAGEAVGVLVGSRAGNRPAAVSPRRRWLWLAAAGVAAVAGGVWLGAARLDGLLHPLPQRRFVVLTAAGARGTAADAALVNNAIDSIDARLVRAESYVKDLLIIGPRDLSATQRSKRPEEISAAFGANLVLAVSLSAGGRRMGLELRDGAGKVLRQDGVRIDRAKLARIPEESAAAAARLLGVPEKLRAVKDREELAGVAGPVYQLFTDAEELRRQPNDAGLTAAVEKYQQALDGDPHFALGYAKLALAYARKHQLTHDVGALAMAERNAQLAIAHNPDSPTAVLSQAVVYLYSGRTEQALGSLSKALKLDPGNPELLLYEAAAYRDLNRGGDEENTYRLIIEQRPNFYVAYNELGLALYRQGRYAESATIFQQAAAVAPRQALPLTNLGVAYQLLGRKDDAMAAFRASLARAPSALAYLSLGNIWFEGGDYHKALESYEKARDLRPSDDLVWRNIGDCYGVLGDRTGMLKNYGSAAEIVSDKVKTNANNGPVWMTLAFYEAKLGHPAEAERDIGMAEVKGAADVQSQFLKAQALAVLGRKDEAIGVLVSCVRRGLAPVEVQLALDLKEIRSDRRYLQQVSNSQPSTSTEDKERAK